ncbi:MAG: Uma2 family endonuclease [Rhizonema sp. PD37]|nr:Uma2 family endonuclease [Rhizonema sp. PD37]
MYQIDPPRLPKEVLPTMYDLKSEDPEEPGLPDQFHLWQPRLLDETFCPSNYPAEQVFVASDLNLYYDLRNPLWYKRPDWFAVLGVSKSSQQQDLRLSYVVWVEGVSPFLVVELLSPGTEAEDLGQTLREINKPPTKWEVYERILRVPYYVIYDRYTNNFRVFSLVTTRYQEISILKQRLWLADIGLGLGLWQGSYQETYGLWLRWYDADGNWIPTANERIQLESLRADSEREQADSERERADSERKRADSERKRADSERKRAELLAARLRELNIDPDQL